MALRSNEIALSFPISPCLKCIIALDTVNRCLSQVLDVETLFKDNDNEHLKLSLLSLLNKEGQGPVHGQGKAYSFCDRPFLVSRANALNLLNVPIEDPLLPWKIILQCLGAKDKHIRTMLNSEWTVQLTLQPLGPSPTPSSSIDKIKRLEFPESVVTFETCASLNLHWPSAGDFSKSTILFAPQKLFDQFSETRKGEEEFDRKYPTNIVAYPFSSAAPESDANRAAVPLMYEPRMERRWCVRSPQILIARVPRFDARGRPLDSFGLRIDEEKHLNVSIPVGTARKMEEYEIVAALVLQKLPVPYSMSLVHSEDSWIATQCYVEKKHDVIKEFTSFTEELKALLSQASYLFLSKKQSNSMKENKYSKSETRFKKRNNQMSLDEMEAEYAKLNKVQRHNELWEFQCEQRETSKPVVPREVVDFLTLF